MSRPPSIYQKLRSNASLTQDEETRARRGMGTTLNKLKAVESEIARLRDRLVVLDQRKRETEKFKQVLQGFFSPIRRLVPEILQEIFWQCLPTTRNSVLSFEEAPLVLGRVCSQWRRIAYATPKLWSSLHIVAVPLTFPGAKMRFDVYDAWLTRSGILPLSISVSDDEWTSKPTNELRPYFDLIARHARRWKYIHLYIPSCGSIDFLTEMDADEFPLLEVFYLQKAVFGEEGGVLPGHPLLRNNGLLFAPLLRVLSINKFPLRLLDLPIQWNRLTGLDLRYVVLSDAFNILTLCRDLEFCAINFEPGADPLGSSPTNSQPPGSRSGSIILPRLHTLSIYGGSTQNYNASFLLETLSTPALRHFAYQHYGGTHLHIPFIRFSSISMFTAFRLFFTRLNEPLEELDLFTEGIRAKYLVEFLSLFPKLKRLSLKQASVSPLNFLNDRLLSGFIPYEHRSQCCQCTFKDINVQTELHNSESSLPSFGTCLCPNLEILNISSALLSKHTLLEFLRSRLVDCEKDGVARLRRFYISFAWRREDHDANEVVEEVERLAEEAGLPDMRLSRCTEYVRGDIIEL